MKNYEISAAKRQHLFEEYGDRFEDVQAVYPNFDDNAKVSTKDAILYGQPKAYHMNLGEGVKVDKDMSVGFRSNSAVYRGVCLADGNLDNAGAFVKYTRATY